MPFNSTPAFKGRSVEVYRTLSEPKATDTNSEAKDTSQECLHSEDLKLSWSQRLWFSARSSCCCGQPLNKYASDNKNG